MRKEDAREIVKVGGKFLLIGPPIGVLLLFLNMLISGRLHSAEMAFYFILLGIPFAYLYGGLPAFAAGLTYGLATLHMGRVPAALISCVIGTISSGLFGILALTELKLSVTLVGALCSLLAAALCRPPKRPPADYLSPSGDAHE
ncbi:hypothetical protein [Geopseudomonas aromaticivorans]